MKIAKIISLIIGILALIGLGVAIASAIPIQHALMQMGKSTDTVYIPIGAEAVFAIIGFAYWYFLQRRDSRGIHLDSALPISIVLLIAFLVLPTYAMAHYIELPIYDIGPSTGTTANTGIPSAGNVPSATGSSQRANAIYSFFQKKAEDTTTAELRQEIIADNAILPDKTGAALQTFSYQLETELSTYIQRVPNDTQINAINTAVHNAYGPCFGVPGGCDE